jgi:hypothetical protein
MASSRLLPEHRGPSGVAGIWTERVTSETIKNQADTQSRRNLDGPTNGPSPHSSTARRVIDYNKVAELASTAPPNRAPPPTPPASELRDTSDCDTEDDSSQARMREQQAHIIRLEAEVQAKQNEIERHQEQIANANAEKLQAILDDDLEKIERLERQVKSLSRMLKEALGKERELQADLADVRRQLNASRHINNDELQQTRSASEAGDQRLKAQLEDLRRDKTVLQDQLSSFTKQGTQESTTAEGTRTQTSKRHRRISEIVVPRGKGGITFPV